MAQIQHLSTTLSDIQIVQAQAVDIEIIRDIYEEVAHWLLGRGLRQWLPEDFSRERTLESIKGFKIFQGKEQEWRTSLYEKKLT